MALNQILIGIVGDLPKSAEERRPIRQARREAAVAIDLAGS